jgi:autotransporter-associated beta strand protein
MKPNTPAPRTFRGLPAIALALAALGLSQPAAQAELLTNTWTNASGDFKWNNDDLASVGRNWTLLSPSPVDSSLQPIWVDGDDAVFGATGAGAISLGTVNTVHNLTVNAAGYAFSGSALTFAGDIPTLTANADFGLGVGLMGSAGLTIQGTGAVTLNPTGPSTYTGGTRVLGGTLILKAGTSANTASSFALHKIEQLDTGATVKYYNELQLSPLDNLRAPNGQLYNKTDMVMTGGTFDLNGDNNQNQMPAPSGFGIITNSSPNDRAVLRIGAAANTTREFSGIIQDGGPVVASPISGKVGFQTHIDLASFDNSAAEIVLSGPNTYTGSTRRGGGHLKLKGAGTLGVVTAGTPSIGLRINGDNNLPAEVDFNGTSQRVSGMGGNGGKIVNDMADTTSVLTLGVAPDHVDTAVASWVGSFRDNSGTGGILAVTKIGTNKQILTGSLHSYSGPTRINEGTIEFGTSAAPSPNSDHYVTSPGKLSLLYAGSKPIKRLILNGVQVGLGTYDALSYPDLIEGPGSIEVTDATDIAAPPSPPTDLAATAGDSQVALTWTAAFQATGDYNIKRSETSGAGYLTIGTASGTSYTDSTAVNDTTYYYVVSATNGAGEGDNSTEVSATPVLPLPPAPPTNLAVIAGNQQISLSWMVSAGAAGYTVKRSLTSGGPYTDEFAATTTTYVDGPLDNATTYYYVVSASNSGGTSGISAEVSATPSASVINVGDPSFEIGGASQKALGKDTPIVAPWGPGGGWGYPYTPPGEPTGGLYATDGVYMAYCNSDSTLSQTLTDTLLPNTLYTLSVDVGRRNDLGMPGYSISLYAGSTLLASASGGSNSFSPGWITAVATYASPSSVTPDQTLKIVLGGKGVQIEFDNVRLDATAASASDYTTWAAGQDPPITSGPDFVGHDGISNLLLYALALKLDGTNGSPGTLTGNVLSFAKRPDAVVNNDVTYAIETSSDLGVTDSWIAATPDVNDAVTISYTLPTGSGGKLFARLRVTQK